MRLINKADNPEDVIGIESKIKALGQMAEAAGFKAMEEQRPWTELRMRARHRLGQLLAGEMRSKGYKATSLSPFMTFTGIVKRIGMTMPIAYEAQHIGALPADELDAALAACAKAGTLCTFAELVRLAKPHWQKTERRARHRLIQSAALRAPLAVEGIGGPFNLIYADPPWQFETWSEKGKGRSAEMHYPTMTVEEIERYGVGGNAIHDIAAKDCVLFLWATPPMLPQALEVMHAWGFDYKTNATWDKVKFGTGYVFRAQHEHLLYGTRGEPPMPINQPSSVMRVERGKHSAKPPQIRKQLELMYPDFDARTRIELFARGEVEDWTVVGFEAAAAA